MPNPDWIPFPVHDVGTRPSVKPVLGRVGNSRRHFEMVRPGSRHFGGPPFGGLGPAPPGPGATPPAAAAGGQPHPPPPPPPHVAPPPRQQERTANTVHNS